MIPLTISSIKIVTNCVLQFVIRAHNYNMLKIIFG